MYSNYTWGLPLTVGINTITVLVTAQDGTTTSNGTAVASGSASGAIALAVCNNTITVLVTAQDGTTKSTYAITVMRISTISTPSNLSIGAGSFSPSLAAGNHISSRRSLDPPGFFGGPHYRFDSNQTFKSHGSRWGNCSRRNKVQ